MKREEGRGEERRGGMEFTLCPRKKKSAPMPKTVTILLNAVERKTF